MARAFDITPVTSSVKLGDSRKGTFEFKVSNGLGKRARVRVRVTPEKPSDPAEGWFSPDPSSPWEKEMTADETAVFRVDVSAPASAAAGDYRFHLSVANVVNPDEEYADGPPVSFTVPPPVVKHFPWWIVIVAAAVVVVGGALLIFFLSRGKKEVAVGTACQADTECSANQRCSEFSPGAKACLLKPQEACLQDRDCTSAWCRDKKCSRDDGKCDTPDECRAPVFACGGGKLCLKTNDQLCGVNLECQSGFCQAGRCKAAPVPCTILCRAGTVCISNKCFPISFGKAPFRFDSGFVNRNITSPSE